MRARRRAAAILLALVAPCAGALELGTLFTSPEERARLDRLRRGESEGVPQGQSEGARAPNPTLTGFVKRSDGRHTVWIDGTPVPLSRASAGTRLEPRDVGSHVAPDSVKIERKTER